MAKSNKEANSKKTSENKATELAKSEKSEKSARLIEAEKAEKEAKAKADKEKKESVAADKAAKRAEQALQAAKKEPKVSYSKLVSTAYSKSWKKDALIRYVKENFEDVKQFEANNRQIAFTISGTRVPKEGFFSVS